MNPFDILMPTHTALATRLASKPTVLRFNAENANEDAKTDGWELPVEEVEAIGTGPDGTLKIALRNGKTLTVTTRIQVH